MSAKEFSRIEQGFFGESRKKSDDVLQTEGAEFVKMMLADGKEATRLELTQQQIESIRSKMEEELSQNEKIRFFSRALMKMYSQDINSKKEGFGQAIARQDGDPQSFSVYDALKEQMANSVREQMRTVISEAKEAEGLPMTQKLAEQITNDVYGGKHTDYVIYVSNYTEVIAGFLQSRENLTANEQKDVEAALRLASMYGQYKFLKWQTPQLLENVIKSQEQLLKISHKTDVANIGYSEAVNSLQNVVAAVQLDLQSKPNYRYAMPSHGASMSKANDMLEGETRVYARSYLAHNEVSPKNS